VASYDGRCDFLAALHFVLLLTVSTADRLYKLYLTRISQWYISPGGTLILFLPLGGCRALGTGL